MHPWFEAVFCFPLQMTGFEDSRSWAVVVMVTSNSSAGGRAYESVGRQTDLAR